MRWYFALLYLASPQNLTSLSLGPFNPFMQFKRFDQFIVFALACLVATHCKVPWGLLQAKN